MGFSTAGWTRNSLSGREERRESRWIALNTPLPSAEPWSAATGLQHSQSFAIFLEMIANKTQERTNLKLWMLVCRTLIFNIYLKNSDLCLVQLKQQWVSLLMFAFFGAFSGNHKLYPWRMQVQNNKTHRSNSTYGYNYNSWPTNSSFSLPAGLSAL